MFAMGVEAGGPPLVPWGTAPRQLLGTQSPPLRNSCRPYRPHAPAHTHIMHVKRTWVCQTTNATSSAAGAQPRERSQQQTNPGSLASLPPLKPAHSAVPGPAMPCADSLNSRQSLQVSRKHRGVYQCAKQETSSPKPPCPRTARTAPPRALPSTKLLAFGPPRPGQDRRFLFHCSHPACCPSPPISVLHRGSPDTAVPPSPLLQ